MNKYDEQLTGESIEETIRLADFAKNAICKYSRATPTIVLRSSPCLSIDRVYCLQALKIISKAVECR